MSGREAMTPEMADAFSRGVRVVARQVPYSQAERAAAEAVAEMAWCGMAAVLVAAWEWRDHCEMASEE